MAYEGKEFVRNKDQLQIRSILEKKKNLKIFH